MRGPPFLSIALGVQMTGFSFPKCDITIAPLKMMGSADKLLSQRRDN
uniref:Uncharacterized protein n=1 Tax=Rhizophora mucronata TaxID=61149 RepID=A0A2P2Q760_RHIMU